MRVVLQWICMGGLTLIVAGVGVFLLKKTDAWPVKTLAMRLFCAVLVAQCLFCGYILAQLSTPLHTYVFPAQTFLQDVEGVDFDTENQELVMSALWDDVEGGYHLQAPAIEVASGAYEMEIAYRTLGTADPSIMERVGVLAVSSARNPHGLISDDIPLTQNDTGTTGRMWVKDFTGMDDLVVEVSYTGWEGMALESVTLSESFAYRVVKLVAYGLAFALLDVLLWVFFVKPTPHGTGLRHAMVLLGVTAFIGLPLYTDFMFYGHDLLYHMERIVAVANELTYGQFPVRMMSDMLNGYGYANSLFYCDIFLYLPAALYGWMVPLRTCYQLYAWLINTCTGLIAYVSFKKMTQDKTVSLVGALLYLFAAYRLVNVYTRAAVGEYTAMAFLPLVVAGVYLIYVNEKPRYQDWMPLAFGMAGLFLSHAITFALAVAILVIVCLALVRKTCTLHRLKAFILAVVATIGLSLWFLVPFMDSMSMDVGITASDWVRKMQVSGLYLIQVFGVFNTAVGQNVVEVANEMPLSLGFSLTLGLVCVLYCCFHRDQFGGDTPGVRQGMCVCFALTLLSVCFTLEAFPWDSMEHLVGTDVAVIMGKIQFPWRWLSIASVVATAATVLALKLLRDGSKKHFLGATGVLLLVAVLTSGYYFYLYMNTSNTVPYSQLYPSSLMYVAGAEYYPVDTEGGLTYTNVAKAPHEDVDVTDYRKEGNVVYASVENRSQRNQTVTFPIFNYNHYQVRDVETGELYPVEMGDNFDVTIQVPPGTTASVAVTYEAPSLWRVCEGISLVTLLVMGYFACPKGAGWRKSRKKQSDEHTVSEVPSDLK